jgi:hypothetical protein
MDYRYKIGEAVLVRDNLEYGAFYNMMSGPYPNNNTNIATLGMSELHGQLVHIKAYTSAGQYLVKETGSSRWTDGMFSGSASNECYYESLL